MALLGGGVCGGWRAAGAAQCPHVQPCLPGLVPVAHVARPHAAHAQELQPHRAAERHCEQGGSGLDGRAGAVQWLVDRSMSLHVLTQSCSTAHAA